MTTKQLRKLLGPEPLIQVEARQLSALAGRLRVDLARVDRAIECLEALKQSPLRRGGPGSFKLVIRERTVLEVMENPKRNLAHNGEHEPRKGSGGRALAGF